MDTCLLSLSDKYLQDSVVSEYKKGKLYLCTCTSAIAGEFSFKVSLFCTSGNTCLSWRCLY